MPEPVSSESLSTTPQTTTCGAALVEVCCVFVTTHVAYRTLQQFTLLGKWERMAGTNFLPGAALFCATLLMMRIGRRDYAAYGLSLRRWRRDLALGVVCSLVLATVAGAALAVSGTTYDPSRPPNPLGPTQWPHLLSVTALGMLGLLTVLVCARREERFASISPIASGVLLLVLLATPTLLSLGLGGRVHALNSLWLFCGAGVGEECFFRGYLQSRLEAACNRRKRILGSDVGFGLVVSSLFFGLVHALNTVDYFSGRWDFGWVYGVQNAFVGLLYGLLRARTGSIWPGAVIHGLLDVLGEVPALVLAS